MNILAVIPARGGSKGIPKKNVRMMVGQPLISYAINNAKKCNLIDDIVVTTDNEEIASIAKFYGVQIIMREAKLAKDNVTLDPVIYDATVKMEKKLEKKYDVVITLQATSPLLKSETLNQAITEFCKGKADTFISAVNSPHLAWSKNNKGFYPLYEKRLNRQELPTNYIETGAFLITKREYVKDNSRIGNNVSIYEVSEEESTDIDNITDWIVCENLLKKKKIILRCDGYQKIGMGHIYHCLTLAYALTGNEVIIVTNQKHEEGLKKIKESHMPYVTVKNDEDFFEFLKDYKPDIVVNDCLDTKEEYVKTLKQLCKRVVTIEDLGEGNKYADVVINALYEDKQNQNNVYSGAKYVALRNEFLIRTPKNFSNEVKEVLVLFGGTDPSNLTKKIYDIIKEIHAKYKKINYTFITGIGYDYQKNKILSDEEYNIKVLNNISNISEYIAKADLAFTSQGRTVYELASLGIPSIVLAQNERELLHTFAEISNGFINLGLGEKVSKENIKKTAEWLIETPTIRYKMRELMLKQDLKNGLNREIKLILESEM